MSNNPDMWAIVQAGGTELIEKHVLHAILENTRDFSIAYSNGLREHHFTTDGTRFIFRLAEAQFKNRGHVDFAGVSAEITEKEAWAKAGGATFFSEMMGVRPSPLAFHDNIHRMKEAREFAEIKQSWYDMRDEVFETPGLAVHERLTKFRQLTAEILYSQDHGISTVYDADAYARIVQEVLEDSIAGKEPAFQKTGIPSLDYITGGLPKSRVTVLAARTSHGKTAFSMWLAEQQSLHLRSIQQAGQILYFSAEMAAQSMATRSLSSLSGINSRRISSGQLTPVDKDDATKHAARFRDEIRISVDTHSKPSAAYMMSTAMALNAIEPIKLVVFDYLEYTGEKANSKDQRLEKAMLGCHELAKRLDCPVVVLSQINREADKRGGIPRISDTRYSGAIEQVAGMVGILFSPWMQWKQLAGQLGAEPPREEYLLSIQKNTQGPVGDIHLHFDRETTSFTDPGPATMRLAA